MTLIVGRPGATMRASGADLGGRAIVLDARTDERRAAREQRVDVSLGEQVFVREIVCRDIGVHRDAGLRVVHVADQMPHVEIAEPFRAVGDERDLLHRTVSGDASADEVVVFAARKLVRGEVRGIRVRCHEEVALPRRCVTGERCDRRGSRTRRWRRRSRLLRGERRCERAGERRDERGQRMTWALMRDHCGCCCPGSGSGPWPLSTRFTWMLIRFGSETNPMPLSSRVGSVITKELSLEISFVP